MNDEEGPRFKEDSPNVYQCLVLKTLNEFYIEIFMIRNNLNTLQTNTGKRILKSRPKVG